MDHVRCCIQSMCTLPLLFLLRAEQEEWDENATLLIICTVESSLLLLIPVWAPSEPCFQWYSSFAWVSALSGFHLVQNEWELTDLLYKEAQTSKCGETECILNIKCSCSSVMLPPVGNWHIWNINQNTWNWSLFDFVYVTLFPLHLTGL